MKILKIEFDQWVEDYKPDLDEDDCPKDYTDIFPEEAAITDCIWTKVSGDFETEYILSGVHLVNRSGYYVTEKPHFGREIEVDCNTKCDVKDLEEIIKTLLTFADQEPVFKHLENSASEFFKDSESIILFILKYKVIDFLESKIVTDLSEYAYDEIESAFSEKELELF